MAIEELNNIKSGTKELRQFGITIGIVLGLLGGFLFLREKNYYFYFLILSFMFLFSGLVAPTLLKPIQKIWMSLAILIGWFVTRLILFILFYLAVTPISIFARIFEKSFLDIKFNRNTDSYWIARDLAKFDRSSYENQY